jgi:hypothetical protein
MPGVCGCANISFRYSAYGLADKPTIHSTPQGLQTTIPFAVHWKVDPDVDRLRDLNLYQAIINTILASLGMNS